MCPPGAIIHTGGSHNTLAGTTLTDRSRRWSCTTSSSLGTTTAPGYLSPAHRPISSISTSVAASATTIRAYQFGAGAPGEVNHVSPGITHRYRQ